MGLNRLMVCLTVCWMTTISTVYAQAAESNPSESQLDSSKSLDERLDFVNKLIEESHQTNSKQTKVILILADGVRWDYVNDPNLTAFDRMRKRGVKASYVQPIFPSYSYPNWYTIVTGKHRWLASFERFRLELMLIKISCSSPPLDKIFQGYMPKIMEWCRISCTTRKRTKPFWCIRIRTPVCRFGGTKPNRFGLLPKKTVSRPACTGKVWFIVPSVATLIPTIFFYFNEQKSEKFWRLYSNKRWDGCQIEIRGSKPTACVEYRSYWSWPDPKIDTINQLESILDHFGKNELQFALVYYEAIDAIGRNLNGL